MPSFRSRRRPARGSALLLAMILLGVLSAIGVAAVALSSRERQNASTRRQVEALQACATAAQARIWAELGRYGISYLGSTSNVAQITLPDGTTLTAPSHYDPDLAKTIQEVVLTADDSAGASTQGDLTNGGRLISSGGHVFRVVAHCKDVSGRQLEVELGMKFAL